MGSSEEERLIQMVNDFIESNSSPAPPIFHDSSDCSSLLSRTTKYLTLLEILRSRTEEEIEVLENVLKHTRNKMDVEKTTSLKKWIVMRLKMDGFNASLCQTSWVTSSACLGGDYEYIEVFIKDERMRKNHPKRLIVDIDFKSQFELARPTPTYTKLSNTLPQIFVGNEGKLIKVISLLCSAAKQSLKERHLLIPPWRTSTYMQSKWFSQSQSNHKEEARETTKEEKGGGPHGFSKWDPPIVMPKRRNLGDGGCGLSSQFSNMSINCC